MKRLDLSRNPRIPLLMGLMDSISQAPDPRELVETYITTMRRAYGTEGFIQISTAGLAPGEYRIARLRTHDGVEHVDHSAIWRHEQMPVYRGGVVGQIVSAGEPAIYHDADLHDDPVLGDKLADYHSLMATQFLPNEFNLNWAVLLDQSRSGFTERALEEIIVRGNLFGAMMNYLSTSRKLQAANAEIQREIDEIARIQRSLLPDHLPEIPGLRLAASYHTCQSAGGDLYDVAALSDSPDARWAILIGDVSGHGPAAAVVMAMVHSILHAYPIAPKGPAEVLSHVNRHLCAKSIEQCFVTALLAFYDPVTRELVYSRAGHHPALVKDFPHGAAPAHLDEVGEIPLGIAPDVHYTEAAITLRPGQTVILYTDGVTDAKHPDGRPFGIDGIEQALVTCSGEPECAIRHIADALHAHQKDSGAADDQTIIAVQVL